MSNERNTIYFIGDSITEGYGASSPEKTYVSLYAKKHIDSKVVNLGIGGTRISRQKNPSEVIQFDQDFNQRIQQINETPDTIVVFGGTNDFGHGDAPLGSFGDNTVWTFYGALHCLIQSLKEKFPSSRLIVCTPLHRSNEETENMHGKKLVDYILAIRETTKALSVELLDLYDTSGIKGNVEEGGYNYLADGLHPNDDGHYVLFKLMDTFINKVNK